MLHLRPQVQHAADDAGARDGAGARARAAAALHGAALARPLHLHVLPALWYPFTFTVSFISIGSSIKKKCILCEKKCSKITVVQLHKRAEVRATQ